MSDDVGETGTGTFEVDPKTGVAPYSPANLDKLAQIKAWLKEHEQSRAWLSRRTRIHNSTLSQVLSGKYPSPPTEYLDRMVAVLKVETERLADGTPGYVEGSVHRLVWVVCDRTRKHANFGVLCGNVGVGKTRSLREYGTRTPQTLMIEANPAMTAGSLLLELLEQLNAPAPHGLDRKFQAVVKALQGTSFLIIADEAETMSASALHYLRRIRDKAGVGVVLAGTTQLHQILKPENGQFDQIRSRVSMWPATIGAITRDDMDDMAREALRDAANADGSDVVVTDEVLDALWAYSHGSARVLMESLIPALRDYGLGRVGLSDKLVDSVASKVLFMKKRAAQ
jgi:DNA transposition AAA+ family ATPase